MDQAILDEVVRRVVEAARPERIILFGSAARGDMGPESDIDLLVVKSGVADRIRLAQEIHLRFFGLPVAVDIVVVSPEDIEQFAQGVGTVIPEALEEGKLLYAA